MLSPVMIRARWLFFQGVLLLSMVATTSATYSQVPEKAQQAEAQAVEAQAVEAQAVEAQAVEAKQVEAQAVEAQAVEAQPVGAQIVAQVGEAVGEAVVEEGIAVAEGAGMFAWGADGDPQASRLLSKVAVDNALVRRVCKLDAEQLKELDSLDAKWVKGKAAARKQAGNLAAGVLRVFAGPNLGGVQQDNPAEAASRVMTSYKTKLKEILKPEQFAVYEQNVKERDVFRCQANAECVVAVLEDRLSFNEDQRKELVKSLSEWSGIQKMQATFYFQNQSYIPNLPASALKALTPAQRKILDGMQKADFQFEMFNDGQEAIFIAQ